MNRKGMLDDVFDLLFTVIVGFFLFFFLNGVLNAGVNQSQDRSLAGLDSFRLKESALNNLRVQVQEGALDNPASIDQRIAASKVLEGRTITSCSDYWREHDCIVDILDILEVIDGSCVWQDGRCRFQARRSMAGGRQ